LGSLRTEQHAISYAFCHLSGFTDFWSQNEWLTENGKTPTFMLDASLQDALLQFTQQRVYICKVNKIIRKKSVSPSIYIHSSDEIAE